MQAPPNPVKDKVPSLKLSKNPDLTGLPLAKGNILDTICSSDRYLNRKHLTHRPSKSQARMKFGINEPGTNSIYDAVGDIQRELSETTLNILNSNGNGNAVIEESFPQVLNDIETSVNLLKKFYLDMCKKKSPTETKNNSVPNCEQLYATESSLKTIEDIRSLPRVDVDVIQNEYEKVYNRRTKDLQTLYEFYIHDYLNGSLKSTNAPSMNVQLINSNSSLSPQAIYHSATIDNNSLIPSLCFDSTGANEMVQPSLKHHKVPADIPSHSMLNNKVQQNQPHTDKPSRFFGNTNNTLMINSVKSLDLKNVNSSKESSYNGSENASNPSLLILRPFKLSGTEKQKPIFSKDKLQQITNVANKPSTHRGKSMGSLEDFVSSGKLVGASKLENKEPLQSERQKDLMSKMSAFNMKEAFELTQKPLKGQKLSLNLQNLKNVNTEVNEKKSKHKKPLSARNFEDKENNRIIEKNIKQELGKENRQEREEVFSKIFAKNMLINKLKQEVNENLQRIISNKGNTKIEGGGLNNVKLSARQEYNPDWFENKKLKATELNDGIIENMSENESERNSESYLKQQGVVADSPGLDPKKLSNQGLSHGETPDNVLNILSQQLPLNNSDLKVINELKTMSSMLSKNEIMSVIQKENDPSTVFHSLQKKVKSSEEFKKTKYFVPEIPRRLPLLDTQKLNLEEDLLHEKELETYYKNRNTITELETILDKSNSGLGGNIGNGDGNEDSDMIVDENDFFKNIGSIGQEEVGLDSNNISFEMKQGKIN